MCNILVDDWSGYRIYRTPLLRYYQVMDATQLGRRPVTVFNPFLKLPFFKVERRLDSDHDSRTICQWPNSNILWVANSRSWPSKEISATTKWIFQHTWLQVYFYAATRIRNQALGNLASGAMRSVTPFCSSEKETTAPTSHSCQRGDCPISVSRISRRKYEHSDNMLQAS